MSVEDEQNSVDILTRQALIRVFPCFASFSDEQTKHLAQLMKEVAFKANKVVVTEGEMVDSIYIIVKGEAEVTRIEKHHKKTNEVLIAALHAGEGIGLNDTGFYSSTGKRTATVTAITNMLLLRLDVNDLYRFLKENNLEFSMYEASQQMLRMRFIKQSLPFSKISHDRLRWLADHVEEQFVPANTVIFAQGEQGDKCYLIRSGEVIITHRDEHGDTKVLAELVPPVLFGEATLISHTPRNATATTVKDTELLVLDHENLSELIESEQNVANMFMNLMVDRSRPDKNPNVTMHHRRTADGQYITILKNPENGNYFKLSGEGAFIWKQLNGKNTMQDITIALAEQKNIFAPDVVAALISKLTKAGYIHNLEIQDQIISTEKPFWVKSLSYIRKVLEFRYAFGDSDNLLTRIYQKYVYILFTRPSMIILSLLAFIGVIAFSIKAPQIISQFIHDKSTLFVLFALIPLSIIETILHELGHAFAVKSFKREVHYIGIGWYWTGPIAFTDTTDMWLTTRKPRTMVNLAGIYVDIIVAGIAALCIFFVSGVHLQALLWIFAAYTYYGAFKMLSPLQELDGYYVLMDWLEKNKLRQDAVLWLLKVFPKSFKNPRLFKKHWPEVIYWISCIVYITIVAIITVTVLSFIFAVLGRPLNIYLSLAMPFIIVILSSLTIIADIRNQKDE